MCIGGSPENTTSTQIVKLPPWLESAYSKKFIPELEKAYGALPQKYPFDPTMRTGPTGDIGRILKAARGMNLPTLAQDPSFRTALAELTRTATGEYQDKNPFMDKLVGKAQEDLSKQFRTSIIPYRSAQAAQQLAFGGTAFDEAVRQEQEDLSKQMADIETQLRGGAYESERDRMFKAAGILPSLGEARTGAINKEKLRKMNLSLEMAMRRLGLSQEALGYPMSKVQQLGQILNMAQGGSTTTAYGPNPNYVSPASQALGAGLAGVGTGLAASSAATTAGGALAASSGPIGWGVGALAALAALLA